MDLENDLDPRIQIELESLNTTTDEINKLEIEFEEANSTLRILFNESTRRLSVLTKKLGSCIGRARPYFEAQEKARIARIECQKAAKQFQGANEIYAAAKETVALAEQRFMNNSHDWQFDNAWQETLNHATIKVMDAEKQKAESHAEHQKKAYIVTNAELKVQQLEDRLRRSIQKSRPYFEEKQICQDQLETQKDRIEELRLQISNAKASYSTSLKNLEQISEDIHRKRGDLSNAAPSGPRQPGVGAELSNIPEVSKSRASTILTATNVLPIPDYAAELGKCEMSSLGNISIATSSAVSEKGDDDDNDSDIDDLDLEQLRQKVKVLAVRPVEGGDGQQAQDVWENELNATVNKLDRLMMIRESAANNINNSASLPSSPAKGVQSPIKMLKKSDPLSSVNASMKELPLLARISNEITERAQKFQIKRRLSLE